MVEETFRVTIHTPNAEFEERQTILVTGGSIAPDGFFIVPGTGRAFASFGATLRELLKFAPRQIKIVVDPAGPSPPGTGPAIPSAFRQVDGGGRL